MPALTFSLTGPARCASQAWAGGNGVVSARGTFDDAVLVMEWCESDSATEDDWYQIGEATALETKGLARFDLPPGYIRFHMRNRYRSDGGAAASVALSVDTLTGLS